MDSQSICGRACTWQRKPKAAYSGAAATPDRASRRAASTSLALLPIDETIPRSGDDGAAHGFLPDYAAATGRS